MCEFVKDSLFVDGLMLTSLLLNIDPDWAPLVLRLALGVALAFHGYPKIFKMKEQFAGWLESMGFKPGLFWAWLVGLTEFVGGIMIAVGFLTELVALAVVIQFLVIMTKMKWGKDPYILGQDGKGWELDMIYFAVALALLFLGSGQWSLEWYLLYGY